MRDAGQRTPRGAVTWKGRPRLQALRAPPEPAEAQDRLVRILADAPREKRAAIDYVTVNQAIDEWLRYVDVEKSCWGRGESSRAPERTVRDRPPAGFGRSLPRGPF